MWASSTVVAVLGALEEDALERILVLSFLLRNQFVDKVEVCLSLCLEV